MRRTPYTERGHRQHRHINLQEPNEFTSNPTSRSDLAQKAQDHYVYLQSKNGNANNLGSRHARSHSKRPLSVNRSNSAIKNKNDEKPEIPLKKDLWVSTVKDNRFKQTTKELEYSKGKIYRGSSWKGDERAKSPSPGFRQEIDTRKINKGGRYLNNLTPTTKEERSHLKQSHRTSGIYDLIGKNLRKKSQAQKEKKEDNFFQYVMRFSYRTKKGSVPSNPNKVNQDAHILAPNINSKTWQHFFSVCDGHGPLGHFVSAYIKNTLPTVINGIKNLHINPREGLMKAFETCYQKMIKESHIDMTFSGSTIIACYMFQNRLFCCNVGDSRAILGRQESGSWSTIPLSEDHKPNIQKQAERIKKMNGRIQSYKDEIGEPIGPLRVWIQNDNVPGLAMTRSFGDLVGASVGVSPVPQIKEFNLTNSDKIILIASDGVFEFLQNDAIIKNLVPFYEKNQIQQASDYLLNMAHKSWTKNSSIIDDITFILIFINYNEI